MIALDHVFVFCGKAEAAPGGSMAARLAAAGLAPSYERRHTGQGTANVCYCFDDAYLELLFVADREELRSHAVEPTGLAARADHRTAGTCPFGFALRGRPLPFPTFDYRFDGLPPGVSIPVDVGAGDAGGPMLFGSPGDSPPIRWTDGRAGARQSAAGLALMGCPRVTSPVGFAPSAALRAVVAAGVVDLVEGTTATWGLTLFMSRSGAGETRLDILPG